MLKNRNKVVIFIVILLVLTGCTLLSGGILISFHYNKLIVEYENKTYQSTYINDYQFSNVDYDKMEEKLLNIKNETLNKKITFVSAQKEVVLKLGDFEPNFNISEIIEKIKNDAKNTSYTDKIRLIKGEILKEYSLEISFDEDKINKVLNDLTTKVDCVVKEEKLVINKDHTVSFDAGNDGYKMNFDKTKEALLNYLMDKKDTFIGDNNEQYRFEIIGEVTAKKITNLSSINKRISTFSTNFNNYGNRGHNITLAVSRVNGTLLQSQGIFSFRQVVGPYTCSNGYRTAPVQSNIGYGCGGGVCQVSTTLYNAQLLAGLETVMRYNHSYAINYVPKGQDATVGGDWVDYQFKNQYQYPIYIVSYIENDKVVMDIWSNDKALGGKKFVVTSRRIASGGYETYLHTYIEDKLVEKRLLHTSYYYG